MRLQKFVFLFSFLFFIILAPKAFAVTVVDTDITENTNWTQDNSPYIVNTPIEIAEGATLTIDPGVIAKFDQDSYLVAFGNINILGTSVEPVYLTSSSDDSLGGDTNGDGNSTLPVTGSWGGILFFNTTDSSSVSNTYTNYASRGLLFFGAHATINNFYIKDTTDDAIALYEQSAITGDTILISNALDSEALGIYDGSSAEIKNLHINGVSDSRAISLYDGSTLSITDSSIENIKYDRAVGIYSASLKASNTIFKNGTGSGISVYSGGALTLDQSAVSQFADAGISDYSDDYFDANKLDIKNSKIEGNGIGFNFYGSNTTYTISKNTINSNKGFGVASYSPEIISMENNFWGDASGPQHDPDNSSGTGDKIFDIPDYSKVNFIPWLTTWPSDTVGCCSSVLFLPGIEASRLYTLGTDGKEKQLWEPHSRIDVAGLYLNPDGTSIDQNIYARDIIKQANTPFSMGLPMQDVYKSFVDILDKMVNEFTIADFKLFAYDWRQDVQDIVDNGAKYQNGNISLVDTLQSLASNSKSGKVTIIAHSNGGLLAKALLKKLQDDKVAGKNNLIDDVDVLILVASPEIGTASAVPAILHGYGQSMLGGTLVDEVNARALGWNAPGAYGLLPSREYINRVSASPVTFVDDPTPSGITTKLVQTFGSAIDSYAEYKDFLFGSEGRDNPQQIDEINLPIILSQNLFSEAETLHNSIDTFTPPAGLRVIEVAGWGIDTVASFEYYPLTNCSIFNIVCNHILDERPRFTSDGDGTVVAPSAQYMSSTNADVEKYWMDLFKYNSSAIVNRNHGNIFEVNPVLDFISNTLQKKTQTDTTYISTTIPADPKNRFRISIHSPVILDAYDVNGNHTGKICSPDFDFCYAEETIPNSSYLEFGEGKYLNFPEDQMSKVELQGTDVGTFTYDSEKVLPDGTSTISSFVDIPVTAQTQAEITLNQNTGMPQLALDVTGDGRTDFTLAPNANFDPTSFLQIMKATIDSLNLSKAQIKNFDNRVDSMIKSIQKGKINKAKLSADKFKGFLEKNLAKPDPKHSKPKKLSKEDAQLLLDMLNKLLDNLS